MGNFSSSRILKEIENTGKLWTKVEGQFSMLARISGLKSGVKSNRALHGQERLKNMCDENGNRHENSTLWKCGTNICKKEKIRRQEKKVWKQNSTRNENFPQLSDRFCGGHELNIARQ